MAEITAAAVKALREQTGQGMMECKKALQQTDGDFDAAQDILRKKGLVTAEKKAARATKEGLVAIKVDDEKTSVVMIEVQCETDFFARNDLFKTMVAGIVDLAARSATHARLRFRADATKLVQFLFNHAFNLERSYAEDGSVEATADLRPEDFARMLKRWPSVEVVEG